MAKLTFIIDPEIEKQLREQNRRKGDISNIINKALKTYLLAHPTEESKQK